MDRSIQIALIVAVGPTITAIASLLVALKTVKAVQEIHLSINSRMDQFLTASRAVGRQEERDDQFNKGLNKGDV